MGPVAVVCDPARMESHLRALGVLAFLVWPLAGAVACASPGTKEEAPTAPATQEGGEPSSVAEAPASDRTDAPAPAAGEPAATGGEAGEVGEGAAGTSPPEGGAAPAPDAIPESRPISQEEVEFGRNFQPLADEFGLTQYAQATRRATSLIYQFLPEGETLESWHTLGLVLLVPVGRSWEEGEQAMPRFIDAFLHGRTGVNEIERFPGNKTTLTFIDYTLGEGPEREHILAAIWQAIPGAITVFQVQRRPDRFDEFHIEFFKDHAGMLAAQAGAAAQDEGGGAPSGGAGGAAGGEAGKGAGGGSPGAQPAR